MTTEQTPQQRLDKLDTLPWVDCGGFLQLPGVDIVPIVRPVEQNPKLDPGDDDTHMVFDKKMANVEPTFVRPAMNEFEANNVGVWILVSEVTPGVRDRQGITFKIAEDITYPTDDL